MGKLKSEQIKDGEVKRDDINVDETGQAVIRKIIAGTGVIITSTGVDAGTGDVTIQATGTGTAVTFTQAVTADPATDITALEAEELTDTSVTELHKHSNLYVPNGSVAALQTNADSGIIIPAYPNTRNDGVSQQALTTINAQAP